MANKKMWLGMLAMVLAFGMVTAGCTTLGALIDGPKADAAAKTFVGKSVAELMTIGAPKYAKIAGRIEQYAFPHWMVRLAANEEGFEQPAITGGREQVVAFTCQDGVVTSYEVQLDDGYAFASWMQM
jgi:hypothetical protein